MNQSVNSNLLESTSVKPTYQQSPAHEVNLFNILRHSLAITPSFGTVLKGLAALISTKPEKKNSIGLLLERQAAAHPNHIAIRYQDITMTYRSLNEQANRLAHQLMSAGIGMGDSVGILLENRPETLISVMATVKLGAIASMLNTSQRNEVLEHSINLTQPKALIVGEEVLDNLYSVKAKLSPALQQRLYYLADGSHTPCPADLQDLDKLCSRQPADNPITTANVQMFQPCYYIFTSGTTGLPKASVMTHYRWFKSMAGMGLASMRMTQKDVLYVSLPLYHNNALTVSMAAVLGAGACVAITRKFSVSRFWDEVRQHGVTAFCYIGELCRYLLNNPVSEQDHDHQVRVIIGNGLRPDIWMDFKQRFNIQHINEFYGASECNLVFTNALNLDKTAGICPLSYNIVQYDIEEDHPIRDAKGFMQPVKKGQVGLLLTEINAKQPFDGYTDTAASDQKVFHNVFKTGDSWFNTGDLVFNQGFKHVAFADRLGDTFRWKGENVATTEVESVLMDFPGIEHAVVYGIEIPHTDGRAGMASISLKIANSALDWNKLTDFLREKLPVYAIPVFIRVREQQEVTGTFKYRKVELKKEAYDLEQINEPIMVLSYKASTYEPLTPTLKKAIDQNTLNL